MFWHVTNIMKVYMRSLTFLIITLHSLAFYIYGSSLFGLPMFHVFSSHMWLVVTALDYRVPEQSARTPVITHHSGLLLWVLACLFLDCEALKAETVFTTVPSMQSSVGPSAYMFVECTWLEGKDANFSLLEMLTFVVFHPSGYSEKWDFRAITWKKCHCHLL